MNLPRHTVAISDTPQDRGNPSPAAPSPAAPSTPAPVVVVAGVPGAGKSVALRQVAADMPSARVLDPEAISSWFAHRLPDGVAYRRYRPLVHLCYWLLVIATLGLGSAGKPLVLHDPGTREWSRRMVAGLARRRHRRVSVVFLDVTHAEALWGQHARGRLVPAQSFDGHWQRWNALRRNLNHALDDEGWDQVLVTGRHDAVGVIVAQASAPPLPRRALNTTSSRPTRSRSVATRSL